MGKAGRPTVLPSSSLHGAINHANHHREQVCAILTGLGIQPPDIQAWEYAWSAERIWDLPESERPTN